MGGSGEVDYFEGLVRVLLEHDGYWTR